MSRSWAAKLYANSPGFLDCLRGKVVILTYHRVVTEQEIATQFIQPGMYVTRDAFASQMRFLGTHFTVLSLSKLLALWDEGRWDAGARYCVVTFDDGWLDTYLNAFPILSTYRVPAAVFLPTGFVGTSKWFWPEKIGWLASESVRRPRAERIDVQMGLQRHIGQSRVERLFEAQNGFDELIEACKGHSHAWIDAFTEAWAALLGVVLPSDRQVVTWDEAREMSAADISFGSHSVSHRILPALSEEEIEQEAVESWASLNRESIRTVPVFCYPNGDWCEKVARCTKEAGYHAAVTTQFGHESADPPQRFGLKRINMHHDITCTDELFAFHIAGFNHRGRN